MSSQGTIACSKLTTKTDWHVKCVHTNKDVNSQGTIACLNLLIKNRLIC